MPDNIPEQCVLSEPQFESGWIQMIDYLADWYWEQDADLRFTTMTGRRMREKNISASSIIGKYRWEQERIWDVDDASWQEHKATLRARKPFKDFVYKITARNGELLYISVSGYPIFDENNTFLGYRGIGNDLTKKIRAEIRLAIEHTVTRCLAHANSVAEQAATILQTICETLHWSCGAYWEVAATQVLECVAVWSDGMPAATKFIQSRKSTSKALDNKIDKGNIAITAWKTKERVWIDKLAAFEDGASQSLAASGSLHSGFALPIAIDGEVVSVLEFYSHHIHTPDAELLDCFAFIAEQIGQHTQIIQARERVRQSEQRFRDLIELSSDWIWEQDERFRFTLIEANQQMMVNNGGHPTTSVGDYRWDVPALNLTPDDWDAHREMLNRHETFHDFLIRRPDLNGRERWVSVSGKPVFDEHGQFKGYRGISKDISERKNSEQRIQYLATHDTLTGLPNRVMFSEMLNHAIHTSKRYARKFAVLFIDLDRFKVINDSLGHEAGDVLLKTVSARLQQCLRASDVVARLGGDEFVVLVQEWESRTNVDIVARKILSALLKPVKLLGQECRVTGSIGICLYPEHAQDEQSLMKNADAAMYQAKESGKNQFVYFSEDIQTQSLERMALENSLRNAFERKQLMLEYQAKLDLKTKRITGVEALLRWQHPELGTIMPTQFIPLAEETGLIVPIGRWVLEQACAQNVLWHKRGMPKLCMAVNLSARQFAEASLVDDIKHALSKSGMAAELLELELTESMVVQKPEHAAMVLREVKKLGVRIAIDDFGTGYSSLAQLKNFPIDILKVDRSFIRDLPTSHDDQSMTKAIIALGKSLGLTVVAEGVETEEQQTFLSDNACDETQGFYFSKPVSSDGIEALLRSYSSQK